MLLYKSFLRLLSFFYLLSITKAENILKSTSLLTCMENSQFSSSYFNVVFHPSDNTVVYDIDGTSLITGKIIAVVDVVVYGLSIMNQTFDLCDLDYESLCPISSGHITLSSSYKIDSDMLDQIPGIAYTIPDLDAYVQVQVYLADDESTPLACVKGVLSNGKTVQTRYAGWPIAVVSGFGLVVSAFVSILGHSATAAHIASNASSLFVYFQFLAITSMMGVALVPPIAAAWAQNFQWSIGIIKAEFMQQMIYWYVQATGGGVTSILANESVISISVQKFLKHKLRFLKRAVSVVTEASADVLSDSDLYTTDEENVGSKTLVLRGVQRVAYLSTIEISNMFMTGIIFFLFVGFILLFLTFLFKGICELLVLSKILKGTKLVGFRSHWRSIIKGSLFRLIYITFPQITLLCIWEFTRNDSAGCIVFAVFIMIICAILLLYAAFRIILMGTRSTKEYHNPAYLLFGDGKTLNKYGFLYSQYKADAYYWVGIHLFYLFARSFLIAILQNHGKVVAVMVFAMEIIYTIALIWRRPFMDKRTNVFNIFIAIINFINSLFYMFFSNIFGAPMVVSSVAAVVYFVMNAIFALILLIFTIVSCTLALVHKNPDTRYEPIKDDRQAFIPNAGKPGTENKIEYELADLGATAMRGHDRNSMLPDSASVELYSSEGKSNSNPFISDDERVVAGGLAGGAAGGATGGDHILNPFAASHDDQLSFNNQGNRFMTTPSTGDGYEGTFASPGSQDAFNHTYSSSGSGGAYNGSDSFGGRNTGYRNAL